MRMNPHLQDLQTTNETQQQWMLLFGFNLKQSR